MILFVRVFELEHPLLHLALAAEESFSGHTILIEVQVVVEHQAGSEGRVLGVLVREFHGTLQVVVMPWIIPLLIGRMRATTTLGIVFDQIKDLLVITDCLAETHFLLVFNQLCKILILLRVQYSAFLFHGDFRLEFLRCRQLEIPILLIPNVADLLEVVLERRLVFLDVLPDESVLLNFLGLLGGQLLAVKDLFDIVLVFLSLLPQTFHVRAPVILQLLSLDRALFILNRLHNCRVIGC